MEAQAPALNRNRILAELSPEMCARLAPRLRPVSLERNRVLYEMKDNLEELYFPINAIVSMVLAGSGRETEVALVGREGFLGVGAYLGRFEAPDRTVVQSSGLLYALPLESLRSDPELDAALAPALKRYVRVIVKTLAQSVYCRAFHTAEQQIARWFLMFLDRCDDTSLDVTHENLARTLGVRRATVTEAALALQSKGLIDYQHGRVTVTNRPGLEGVVCECYWAVQEDAARTWSRGAS